MAAAIGVRSDYTSVDLRQFARRSGDPAQVRRLLAVALILDGGSRSEAAKVAGVTLQIVRKPEGDCTEHAVLLATLGRALGIATRVVDGLAYTDYFANRRNVFVPHAWMQAWVDGRWKSFDAALAGFDAGHIAFSSGDGDPWRFYNGLDLLGRTKLLKVEATGNATRQ